MRAGLRLRLGRPERDSPLVLSLSNASQGRDAEIGRHPNELRDGIGLHLFEHAVAVDLRGLFGDAEVEADLLVELPADQMSEDLALARAEAIVARIQRAAGMCDMPSSQPTQRCAARSPSAGCSAR